MIFAPSGDDHPIKKSITQLLLINSLTHPSAIHLAVSTVRVVPKNDVPATRNLCDHKANNDFDTSILITT